LTQRDLDQRSNQQEDSPVQVEPTPEQIAYRALQHAAEQIGDANYARQKEAWRKAGQSPWHDDSQRALFRLSNR
jgi:hypothetical protein